MIKRFVFSMVEVPTLVILLGCVLISFGSSMLAFGSPLSFAINIGTSLLLGGLLLGYGIKEGRRQVMRLVAVEQWKAAVVILPKMIEDLPDEAPEGFRQALQGRLREAKEGLALESEL